MADARGESQWVQTSAVLAMLANANRDPKKKPRPYQPNDFNPFARRAAKQRPLPPAPVSILKEIFVK